MKKDLLRRLPISRRESDRQLETNAFGRVEPLDDSERRERLPVGLSAPTSRDLEDGQTLFRIAVVVGDGAVSRFQEVPLAPQRPLRTPTLVTPPNESDPGNREPGICRSRLQVHRASLPLKPMQGCR